MIQQFCSNVLPAFSSHYCLMIGLTPSLGAKSPGIWNHFLLSSGLQARMYPVDIPSVHSLHMLLSVIDNDPSFIGGAVAAPYKREVFLSPHVHVNDRGALSSSSVNCIYRNSQGRLCGCNTDGIAFIQSLHQLISPTTDIKSVLIYGLGATGRAIAANMPDHYKLTVFNRTQSSDLLDFAQNLNAHMLTSPPADLSGFDLIVNATTLGSAQFNSSDKTLFTSDIVSTSKHSTIYYDINYDPPLSSQSQCFKNINRFVHNGLSMNQLQAYIAISKVFDSYSLLDIANYFAPD